MGGVRYGCGMGVLCCRACATAVRVACGSAAAGGCAATVPLCETGSHSGNCSNLTASVAGVAVTSSGFTAAGACPPAYSTIVGKLAIAVGGLLVASGSTAAGGHPPACTAVAGNHKMAAEGLLAAGGCLPA